MRTFREGEDEDFSELLAEQWNKRLRSVRRAGFAVAILMIVLGIVLCIFPAQSASVIEVIAAILIMAFGIYEFIVYFHLPILLQRGGILIDSTLNVILGILLLASPPEVGISTFALLFGFLLLVFGIDLLAFSGKLGYFRIEGYGWVIATGVISVIGGVLFMFLPFAATVALNYVIAIYLIIGGAAALIEAISMHEMKIPMP